MAFPRAAVVIGVGRVAGMAPLTGAVPMAKSVAAWLVDPSEGYEVELLTDEHGPVTAAQVEAAIGRFVTEPPRYRQLLVYFIGHGLWHGRADRWLLSGAARQGSQAINLDGAMELARYSGIPNVIFVSDACRSLPASLPQANVQGIDAFPSIAGIARPSKVDVFKATTDARAAYEIPDPNGAGRVPVLSWALRRAFTAPQPDMVLSVRVAGRDLAVVPNRRLEPFLQEAVDDVLAPVDPYLTQHIEAIVPSADDVYIARMNGQPVPLNMPGGGRRGGARRTGTARAAGRTEDWLSAAERDSPLASAPRELLPVAEVGQFESGCGLTVRGAVLAEVLASGQHGAVNVDLFEPGTGTDGDPAIARVHSGAKAGSLLLRFADRSGAVVPFVRGHITHVSVAEAGVSQIAMVPCHPGPEWVLFAQVQERTRVDRLRAALSAAMQEQRFLVSSEDQARRLDASIRRLTLLDPSLGLYAAHAFAQLGQFDRVGVIAERVRKELGVGLYDLELLSRPPGEALPSVDLAPFCPLLSQTWSLLRAHRAELPEHLASAQPHLRNALWTSFEAEGVEAIARALRRPEVHDQADNTQQGPSP